MTTDTHSFLLWASITIVVLICFAPYWMEIVR